MVVVVPGTSTPAPSLVAPFSDLLDLRTAVIENVNRPDIADVFPRLVSLAEARFDQLLKTRAQISTQTLTLVGGRASLPADFGEAISVSGACGGEYLQQSPQFGTARNNVNTYSLQGDEIVGPLAAGDVQMMYYARIPRLVAMDSTNWLLGRYPAVYLYGVSFEAAKQVRDMELAQINQTLMDEAIMEARADDSRARYSRARVRVSGPTP